MATGDYAYKRPLAFRLVRNDVDVITHLTSLFQETTIFGEMPQCRIPAQYLAVHTWFTHTFSSAYDDRTHTFRCVHSESCPEAIRLTSPDDFNARLPSKTLPLFQYFLSDLWPGIYSRPTVFAKRLWISFASSPRHFGKVHGTSVSNIRFFVG